MTIDNTDIMQNRSDNFTEFRKTIHDFEDLLQNTNVLQFAHKSMKNIQEITDGNYIWGTIKFFFKTLFSGDFWKIAFKAPSIYKIYQNFDKPEMQKLLVEETSLLEQVGKNKEITKELLNDLVFTQDNEQTKLLKQVTGATIDLLHDKDARDKLKTELVNNYFKFGLNSFDREGFINNFVKYERSQITDKIKDETNLVKLLKAKSDIRLGDSNYNLRNVIKSLNDNPTQIEISNAVKAQLRHELGVLGLTTDKIDALTPEALKLSVQDAQKILQGNYDDILGQKINDVHNRIMGDIRQNGAITNFDSYISDILEEHARYIVDVQEPLYQQNYVNDYVRFSMENDPSKNREDLAKKALVDSYNIAPDYMRLTQNVLRIVDTQDNGVDDNLKGVLRTRGKDLINYVKDFTKEQKITSVLNELKIESEELTELSSWIKEFDQSNDKTIKEIVEHIFKEKLDREIPENLQETINTPQTQTMLDMLNNFGIDNAVLDLVPLTLSEDDGIAKIANMTESIRTKFIFNWTEDLLNFINSNPKLQQKFIDNPEISAELTKGIVNNIPFLKNLCQDLGCTDQVFDIISILIKTPEDTQKIFGYLNEEKYVELAQKFVEIAHSNEELRNYLTTHKDVYKQLVSSLFKEIDLMRNLKDNAGITNTALEMILDTALVMDKPVKFKEIIDVSNQIFDITSKYVTDNNLGDFSNLQTEDYVKLTKIVLQNEDLFKLLETNKIALGNFAKLLTEKVPWLKAKKVEILGNVEIDKLVPTLIESGILKNKDSVSAVLDRYVGDGYKAVTLASYAYNGASVLKNLLAAAPIMNYLSSPSIKEDLSALIKKNIHSNTTHDSLSELLKGSGNIDLINLGNTKDLTGITLDDTDFSKIQNIQGFSLINSNLANSNFSNVGIQNTSFTNTTFQSGVNFENATLKNVNFSNAKFSAYKIVELYVPRRTETTGNIEQGTKISFKNATLKNVNFSEINLVKSASYSDDIKIDFEGATIDRSTFNSLVSVIRKNPSLKDNINLRGAKIIGDLSELDLSGVNLEGSDLSDVSSLKGTVVSGANLKDTNVNSELLKEALQLENLQTDFALNEIVASQKQNKESIIIGKISKVIVNKLIRDGKLVVKGAAEITLLIEQLNTKLLTEIRSLEGSEKEFLYDLFEKNYTNLDQFAVDLNAITHYSDLNQTPQAILNTLYANAFSGTKLSDLNLANALKYEQMKNLLADEVGKKLFGDGQNRGQDFIIIRKHLTNVFNQLSSEEKQNLYNTICNIEHKNMVLNASPECETLLNLLKDQYYSKTRYTKVGVVTSGVYIPTSNALDEFAPSDLTLIKVSSDLDKIKVLSKAVGDKIGEKLFGDNMSSSREVDTQKIIGYLNTKIFPHVLCNLPKEEKKALLDTIDFDPEKLEGLVDKLVGNFNKVNMVGMKKVNENSLSQIFYNNTSYTKLGNVVGGIQLNTTKLNSQDFFDSVEDCVMGKCKSDLSKIEEIAEKIGNKLGEKLFGENASSSRKEDVLKIIATLNKVVLPSVIGSLSNENEKENFLNANSQTINSLVGDYEKTSLMNGFWSKEFKNPSLSQIFYDNSSYTKVGLASGGIQIDSSTLEDKPFLDKIKHCLETKAKLSTTQSKAL